jgi:hypothetical protein
MKLVVAVIKPFKLEAERASKLAVVLSGTTSGEKKS